MARWMALTLVIGIVVLIASAGCSSGSGTDGPLSPDGPPLSPDPDPDPPAPPPPVPGGDSLVMAVAPTVVPGVAGAYPDIALDSLGGVHLVYASGGSLWYMKWEAESGWGTPENTGLSQAPSYRNEPDIAVDSLGRPHVCGGTGGGGGYAYRTSGSWFSVSPGTYRDTELALDSQDNVYIIDRGGSDGGYIGVRFLAAGGSSFTNLPDPDITNGLPIGRNDHVYGDIFIGPNDAIHIVYRHGAAPGSDNSNTVYRGSGDGGASYVASRVTSVEREGPHVVVRADGTILVTDSRGNAYRSDDGGSSWTSEGRVVDAGDRMQPELSVARDGRIFVSSFGGRYNVRDTAGNWLATSRTVTSVTGENVGFMETAAGRSACYVVWEEGSSVTTDNDGQADNFTLVFASIGPDGSVGGN